MNARRQSAPTVRVKSKTYLQIRGRGKFLVCKQLGELLSGLNPVTLILVLGTKCHGQVHKVPFLNVVVALLPSVNISLDGKPFVADHKAVLRVSKYYGRARDVPIKLNLHYGVELIPDHGAHFLESKLETTIANEENGSAVILLFRS